MNGTINAALKAPVTRGRACLREAALYARKPTPSRTTPWRARNTGAAKRWKEALEALCSTKTPARRKSAFTVPSVPAPTATELTTSFNDLPRHDRRSNGTLTMVA